MNSLGSHVAELATLPRYRIDRSYDWNYEHAPDPLELELAQVPGNWQFCGLAVDSPLGMPAGPLLNGRWVLYYASLGFDVLTYKTVRSRARDCYAMPNLVPVQSGSLWGGEPTRTAAEAMDGSWAVSFGMPSKDPSVWRADVEATRRALPSGKLLSVSVVATEQPGWNRDDLAADYAKCARWAMEAGADCVETNFSCPNVDTCDGSLYQDPEGSAAVAARVRAEIRNAPYIIKIGRVLDPQAAEAFIAAVEPYADALAMTNSIATQVRDSQGAMMFDAQPRGICGRATFEASLDQVAMFRKIATSRKAAGGREKPLALIGVGGAATAADVLQYLEAGAQAVHVATAAMVEPGLALDLRRDLADRLTQGRPR